MKFNATSQQARTDEEYEKMIFNFRMKHLNSNTSDLVNEANSLVTGIRHFEESKVDLMDVLDHFSRFSSAVYSVKNMKVENFRGIDASNSLETCISYADKVKNSIQSLNINDDDKINELVELTKGRAIFFSISLRKMTEEYEKTLKQQHFEKLT